MAEPCPTEGAFARGAIGHVDGTACPMPAVTVSGCAALYAYECICEATHWAVPALEVSGLVDNFIDLAEVLQDLDHLALSMGAPRIPQTAADALLACSALHDRVAGMRVATAPWRDPPGG